MTSTARTFAVSLVGLVVAVVLAIGLAGEPGPAATERSSPGSASTPRLPGASSESVLAIVPGLPSPAPAVSERPRISPLMQSFLAGKGLADSHARLMGASRLTGEEAYVLAQILRRCATIVDEEGKAIGFRSGLSGPAARERLVASLSPRDPAREKRIAAFDRMDDGGCAALRGVKTTLKDIRALLEQGSRAGDPKARAAVLQEDLWKSALFDPATQRRKPLQITDAQLQEFQRIVESGDPQALVEAMSVPTIPLGNFSLRGPDDAPLQGSALHPAAMLIACERGLPCDADSPALLEACALGGLCDAASYRDYLFYYQVSPGTAQRILRYRTWLEAAVDRGDWSNFNFYRGPSPMGAVFSGP
jgi:hypothetical protein